LVLAALTLQLHPTPFHDHTWMRAAGVTDTATHPGVVKIRSCRSIT
jgi:hypothetical protein